MTPTMPPTLWNYRDPNCPPDAVNIGRPSRWGNPYIINVKQGRDRATVIRLYKEWLMYQLRKDTTFLEPLRGKHLYCWCKPQACHGDMIIDILYNIGVERFIQ